jgi:hypothetical protein
MPLVESVYGRSYSFVVYATVAYIFARFSLVWQPLIIIFMNKDINKCMFKTKKLSPEAQVEGS